MKKIITLVTLSLLIPITTFAATVPWNRISNTISPLDTTWNVGVGTDNPLYMLDVRDGTDIYDDVYLLVDNVFNNVGMQALGGIILNPNINSYVGIHTATPQAALDVVNAGQTASILRVDNNDNFVGIGSVASNDPSEFEGLRVDFRYGASWPYLHLGSPAFTGNGTTFVLDDYNSKFYFNGGNVGIGTTTPSAKLDIYGTAGSSDIFAISSSTNARLLTVTAGGNVGIGTAVPVTQAAVGLHINGVSSEIHLTSSAGGELVSDGTQIQQWTDNNFYITNREAGAIILKTNASEALRISSTGNVGIGTTSPTIKLQVNDSSVGGIGFSVNTTNAGTGIANMSGFSLSNTNATANNWAGLLFGDNTNVASGASAAIGTKMVDRTNHYGDIAFGTRAANGFLERMRILSTGNVGIGTTNPGAKLSISAGAAGADTEQIRFNRTNDDLRYSSIYYTPSASAGVAGILSFKISDGVTTTSQTNTMTLNGGNVGIGTTTPPQKLTVAGNILTGGLTTSSRAVLVGDVSSTYPGIWFGTNAFAPDVTNYAFLYDSTNGTILNTPASKNFYFRVGNENKLIVYSDGTVGIGTVASGEDLTIHGTTTSQTDDVMFRLQRPISNGQYYPQSVDFAVNAWKAGGGGDNYNPATRLDIRLRDTRSSAYVANVNVMSLLNNGYVGIGTTTPNSTLQVTSTSTNATTTLTVGRALQNKGSCLELYDAGGTAIYASVAAGDTTFTLSTVSCK